MYEKFYLYLVIKHMILKFLINFHILLHQQNYFKNPKIYFPKDLFIFFRFIINSHLHEFYVKIYSHFLPKIFILKFYPLTY